MNLQQSCTAEDFQSSLWVRNMNWWLAKPNRVGSMICNWWPNEVRTWAESVQFPIFQETVSLQKPEQNLVWNHLVAATARQLHLVLAIIIWWTVVLLDRRWWEWYHAGPVTQRDCSNRLFVSIPSLMGIQNVNCPYSEFYACAMQHLIYMLSCQRSE